MAIIVSSHIESISLQSDGRSWVHEVHIDQASIAHDHSYLANAGADTAAALAAYAVVLGNVLTDSEIAGNLAAITANGSVAVMTLIYTTLSQTMNVARPIYATAVGPQAVNLGDWFNTRSFIELQNAFNFANVAAYNAFKQQFFVPNANAASSVRTSVGG